jgi:signal transduction histidine kinase
MSKDGNSMLDWVQELYRLTQSGQGAETFHALLERIARELGAERGALALKVVEDEPPIVVAMLGCGVCDGMHSNVPEHSMLWQAQESGRGLLRPAHAHGSLTCLLDSDGAPNVSAMCWPLRVGERVAGALCLCRSGKPYGEDDLRHGEELAALASAIVENLRMHAEQRERIERLTELNARFAETNKKLEQASNQLLQSEKMASIGQLAAGVAHEINNPVGYVYSNLGSLEKYLGDFFSLLDAYERCEPHLPAEDRAELAQLRQNLDVAFLRDDVKALLGESREGINRVKKIVQDLKDFSHVGTEEDWQWSDLLQGLDSTLNIVWNELKYKCKVVKELSELPRVLCLPSQLNQVFMNLLVNAAQAIEIQGTITLRSGTEGRMVWISVSDTGHGIPPENLTRIFDPFFTTKLVGKGTGLGLSVSYSIVQKHRGRIEVESEVGKGTTFRMWLPIQPEGVERQGARP